MDNSIFEKLDRTLIAADEESTGMEIATQESIEAMFSAPQHSTDIVAVDKRAETSPVNGAKGGRPPKKDVDLEETAMSFLRDSGAIYRLFHGEWFRFNGKFYDQVTEDDIKNHVVRYIHRKSDLGLSPVCQDVKNLILNIGAIGAIESLRSMPCWLNREDNDKDNSENWVILQNTLVNVTELSRRLNGLDIQDERIFRPHTPDFFSTIAMDYEYDPEAGCPLFMKYLNEVQPDEKDREIIQMMFGLALIPDTSYEVIFILFGQGGTGKSVCLEILQALVSKRNVCCLPLSKFTEKHSTHLLVENLLNIVGDLPTSNGQTSLHHIEGILKDVTSGGMVSVEKKFKEPHQANAIARNIFATNSLPAFADRSNGIWDRLRIIPFDQVFRGTENQNLHLARDIIENEMPGIFNWAIEGLAKLKQMPRFPHSERGAQLADEHRASCDHEGEFIRANYLEDTGSILVAEAVYSEYREHCQRNGYIPKNHTNFYVALRRLFPSVYWERRRLTASVREAIPTGHGAVHLRGRTRAQLLINLKEMDE